jgi:hypothetical protein
MENGNDESGAITDEELLAPTERLCSVELISRIVSKSKFFFQRN